MDLKKMKVMTVVGTRPEVIRLSRVIPLLDKTTEHILVHTGQNYDYELNEIFFQDLELRKPDYFLDAAGATPAETVGRVIATVDKVMEKEQPEALLILGDTNSCLAAYPAKRRKIPVFHMEAGNRCFDQRVPEEINRKIVDHISDINLPYSSIAREYLLREGLPADRIIKTGSPMFEVLTYFRSKIEGSDVLTRLDLRKEEFFLVSAHREENIEPEGQFTALMETLQMLVQSYGRRVIVSTHPRTRHRMERSGGALPMGVEFLKPLGFLDYVKLQMNARTVLSDSGTITEESSILNFPAINIRDAHERPEGMEEASVVMTGLQWERVSRGLCLVMDQRRGEGERAFRLVADYNTPNVSEKIPRIILSYTSYVQRTVWSSVEPQKQQENS